MKTNRFMAIAIAATLLASCEENQETTIPVSEIKITPSSLQLTLTDNPVRLEAEIYPEDATDKTLSWSSSDETIATVTDGLVTPISLGCVTITATSGEVQAECEVTVVEPEPIEVTEIVLSPVSLEIKAGSEPVTLEATIYPEDATDKTITWSSSDENIVTVSEGQVTPLSMGNATITAASGDVTATCEVTVTPMLDCILIKAGKFMMGSPESEKDRYEDEVLHEVTLTKDFYLSTYETTNTQFALFLNNVGVKGDGKFETAENGIQTLIYEDEMGLKWDKDNEKWIPSEGMDEHPAVSMTWFGAYEFALWCGGTLPTEAQWEYACRAGTSTVYSFGDDASLLGEYAIYKENSNKTTQPVGSKKPNPWGLYDMHGNVYEWCYDSTNATAYDSTPVTDPVSPKPGFYRVFRGGSMGRSASYLRSAYRFSDEPQVTRYDLGVRVAFIIE